MTKQALKLAVIIAAIVPGVIIIGCQAGQVENLPREETVDQAPESPASDPTGTTSPTPTATENQQTPGKQTGSGTTTTKTDAG